MTQENKQLLLKDLGARLPYSTLCYCKWTKDAPNGTSGCIQEVSTYLLDELMIIGDQNYECQICEIKPYLRSMSSMTKEERKELNNQGYVKIAGELYHYCALSLDNAFYNPERHPYVRMKYVIKLIDWLNAHHFDYRGLIEKGLAIEAPTDMYNIKEK